MKIPEGATQDIIYRPVWAVDRPAVDMFYALPIMRSEDGAVIKGLNPLDRHPTVEATMMHQVKYLTQALQALQRSAKLGEPIRLVVRINSVALATKEAAGEVTEELRVLSDDERKQIVPEIVEFPKSLSMETMDDITIPLMAFFDTWIARPEKEHADFTPFANLNYGGVTLDLEDKPLDLKLAGKIFQLFALRASHRRLPTWLLGVPTLELAKLARIAGMQVISGSYMNMDDGMPGPVLEGDQPFRG
ncbi:hypothetical protein V5T82_02030 [Magnetovibrio sp. PR-2]|uniref:hypothetical protein n=1 Tax=Magnetovibrio sp. PR-2 TaxID=3120356 RepID=UPI002FCE5884